MLDVKIDVDSVEELEKYIDKIRQIIALEQMKSNPKLFNFIADKCLETVKKVSYERITGGSTDDEYIEEYISRHKIRQEEDGFVLYNDFVLPVEMLPIQEQNVPNYEKGFSIALAFEYGVGIVGEDNYDSEFFQAWEYNVNKHNFAWNYVKDGVRYSTYGYMGFEVYRFTAEEIINQLPNWVAEYFNTMEE